MKTVNVHEAKTHLSRLIAETAEGDTIVIARAGKPVAKLSPIDAVERPVSRIGFMRGAGIVPDDFDRIDEEEIRVAFEGGA
ncbi:type II toxin-antitoxin system Phd/YefM family antitoxin [Agromyces silvae]|uniref:type II toxin-antitoxin system Phd/YefM family antitoxin n=1 Tax=Agromyces silvae TaxID=3388266 RepID=UPI00280A87CA|nr:type II toxin-antitoxin system prevent-host-death family antitoxin [Agromyces protaetiae]